jgi:hypothetical protein
MIGVFDFVCDFFVFDTLAGIPINMNERTADHVSRAPASVKSWTPHGNFGDIDCKSLHLGPEIDATHTLLTATYMM